MIQNILLLIFLGCLSNCAKYQVRDGREPVGRPAPQIGNLDPNLNPITEQPIENQFIITSTPNPSRTGESVRFQTPDAAGHVVRWDLGNGGFAQGTTIQHIYYQPGDYNVVATKTLATGEILTATLVHRVVGTALPGVPNLPPAIPPLYQNPQDCQKTTKCCCNCRWVGPIRRWLFGCY